MSEQSRIMAQVIESYSEEISKRKFWSKTDPENGLIELKQMTKVDGDKITFKNAFIVLIKSKIPIKKAINILPHQRYFYIQDMVDYLEKIKNKSSVRNHIWRLSAYNSQTVDLTRVIDKSEVEKILKHCWECGNETAVEENKMWRCNVCGKAWLR